MVEAGGTLLVSRILSQSPNQGNAIHACASDLRLRLADRVNSLTLRACSSPLNGARSIGRVSRKYDISDCIRLAPDAARR